MPPFKLLGHKYHFRSPGLCDDALPAIGRLCISQGQEAVQVCTQPGMPWARVLRAQLGLRGHLSADRACEAGPGAAALCGFQGPQQSPQPEVWAQRGQGQPRGSLGTQTCPLPSLPTAAGPCQGQMRPHIPAPTWPWTPPTPRNTSGRRKEGHRCRGRQPEDRTPLTPVMPLCCF